MIPQVNRTHCGGFLRDVDVILSTLLILCSIYYFNIGKEQRTRLNYPKSVCPCGHNISTYIIYFLVCTGMVLRRFICVAVGTGRELGGLTGKDRTVEALSRKTK